MARTVEQARVSSLLTSHHAYEVEESEAASDGRWDEFLIEAPGGDHVQSSTWGQLKVSGGWRTLRLVASTGGRIVGGAQMLIRPVPMLGAVAYVPRGPVVAAPGRTLMTRLLEELVTASRRLGIRLVAIHPPFNGHYWEDCLLSSGFCRERAAMMPTATMTIRLEDDLDTIFARVRKRTRKAILSGLRRGISVRPGSDDDLPTFHRLLSVTAKRQGFTPEPLSYFRELWRLFRPLGQAHLFLAEYAGEALSAELDMSFGSALTAKRAGWSGSRGALSPNDVLQWEILRLAKEAGYCSYDVDGIDPGAAEAVLEGRAVPARFKSTPTAFKLKYGGEVVRLPGAFVYLSNGALRWGYKTLGARLLNSPRARARLGRLRVRS